MNKKKERRGGLIRKKSLTNEEDQYRVLCIDQNTGTIRLIGTYESLEKAKQVAISHKTDTNDLYVHGNSNRVLARV